MTNIPWLLKPYLPREGIVFLYGKKGVGKSPLTWSLARAVASGESWCGFDVQERGPVLYIEVDSPLSLVAGRMQGQTPLPKDVSFYFPHNPFLIGSEGREQARQDLKDLSPKLVIVNTLRKIHALKDTDSATVAFVYGSLRTLFPGACVLIVHHEKKTPADPSQGFEEGEEFSGSLAWHNDANVCLNLRRAPGVPASTGTNLILKNTGSQLHAQVSPLPLLLGADGFTISLRYPRH